MVVDLPAPFSPIKPITVPEGRENEMSSKVNLGKRLVKCRISSAFMVGILLVEQRQKIGQVTQR